MHATLCSILSDAVEGGFLSHNPAWRTYRYAGRKCEKKIADEETAQKIIAALEGESIKYCLFPDDENRKFSVYYMELAPGSHWQSEPHLRGTTEFVTLFAGAIEITADQKAIVVQAGESVRFQGDTTHAYRNISDQTTILHMILYNP